MKFLTVLGLGLIPFAVAQAGDETLGPAPTESYGCEPHGDHYHCEGHVSETAVQATTTVAAPTTTPDHDHHDHDGENEDHDHDHDGEDHEDNDHDDEAGSLPPSPTASVGCEPHGDHWHCDGPATATSTPTEGSDEATGTDDSSEPTGTGGVAAQFIPLAGALAAVAFAL